MATVALALARQEFEDARNRFTYLLDCYGLLIYGEEPGITAFPPEVAAALLTVQYTHEHLMRLLVVVETVPDVPLPPDFDIALA